MYTDNNVTEIGKINQVGICTLSSQVQCSAAMWSPVQSFSVQQCSAVQRSRVPFRAYSCSAVQCNMSSQPLPDWQWCVHIPLKGIFSVFLIIFFPMTQPPNIKKGAIVYCCFRAFAEWLQFRFRWNLGVKLYLFSRLFRTKNGQTSPWSSKISRQNVTRANEIFLHWLYLWLIPCLLILSIRVSYSLAQLNK